MGLVSHAAPVYPLGGLTLAAVFRSGYPLHRGLGSVLVAAFLEGRDALGATGSPLGSGYGSKNAETGTGTAEAARGPVATSKPCRCAGCQTMVVPSIQPGVARCPDPQKPRRCVPPLVRRANPVDLDDPVALRHARAWNPDVASVRGGFLFGSSRYEYEDAIAHGRVLKSRGGAMVDSRPFPWSSTTGPCARRRCGSDVTRSGLLPGLSSVSKRRGWPILTTWWRDPIAVLRVRGLHGIT